MRVTQGGADSRRGNAPAVAALLAAIGVAVAALIKSIFWPRGPRLRLAAPRRTALAWSDPGDRQASGRVQAASPDAPATERDGAPRRAGWFGLATLALAVGCGVIALFSYNELSNWYRPVGLLASSHDVVALTHLTLTSPGAGSAVPWTLKTAYVGQLQVSGPDSGTARVNLPLPSSYCQRLAAKLGGQCDASNQLLIPVPATFTWSATPPLLRSAGGRPAISTGLDISGSAPRPGTLAVTLAAQAARQPSLSFSQPIAPTTLVVRHGSRLYSHHFGGNAGTAPTGLAVIAGSAGSGRPPLLSFSRIGLLSLVARGQVAAITGFSGRIDIGAGGTTVLARRSVVSMQAAGAPLVTRLRIGPAGQSAGIRSAKVTSVMTASGQLVPSEWARATAFWAPVLGGFVTAAVLTPLSVSVQVLTDALKNWPGPARRRRHKRRGKEERHAR
jgi:hypothetical protein